MEWLFTSEFWLALFTLATLEIVLGVDNLVFISIAVSKLPPRAPAGGAQVRPDAGLRHPHHAAGVAGLPGTHAAHLFSLLGQDFSVRDLVLIGGGLFLLVKGTMEIHDSVEAAATTRTSTPRRRRCSAR